MENTFVDCIQWSKRTYTLRMLLDFCPPPCIVCVPEGYKGGNEVENIPRGQVVRIHSVFAEKRVFARCLDGRVLSIPETFPIKFEVVKKTGKRRKAKRLNEILSNYRPPIVVALDRKDNKWNFGNGKMVQSEESIGTLVLFKAYFEYFARVNQFINGVLDRHIFLIPLYLDVDVRLAEGLKNGKNTDYSAVMKMCDIALRSLDYSAYSGLNAILMFDPSIGSAHPLAASSRSSRANSARGGNFLGGGGSRTVTDEATTPTVQSSSVVSGSQGRSRSRRTEVQVQQPRRTRSEDFLGNMTLEGTGSRLAVTDARGKNEDSSDESIFESSSDGECESLKETGSRSLSRGKGRSAEELRKRSGEMTSLAIDRTEEELRARKYQKNRNMVQSAEILSSVPGAAMNGRHGVVPLQGEVQNLSSKNSSRLQSLENVSVGTATGISGRNRVDSQMEARNHSSKNSSRLQSLENVSVGTATGISGRNRVDSQMEVRNHSSKNSSRLQSMENVSVGRSGGKNGGDRDARNRSSKNKLQSMEDLSIDTTTASSGKQAATSKGQGHSSKSSSSGLQHPKNSSSDTRPGYSGKQKALEHTERQENQGHSSKRVLQDMENPSSIAVAGNTGRHRVPAQKEGKDHPVKGINTWNNMENASTGRTNRSSGRHLTPGQVTSQEQSSHIDPRGSNTHSGKRNRSKGRGSYSNGQSDALVSELNPTPKPRTSRSRLQSDESSLTGPYYDNGATMPQKGQVHAVDQLQAPSAGQGMSLSPHPNYHIHINIQSPNAPPTQYQVPPIDVHTLAQKTSFATPRIRNGYAGGTLPLANTTFHLGTGMEQVPSQTIADAETVDPRRLMVPLGIDRRSLARPGRQRIASEDTYLPLRQTTKLNDVSSRRIKRDPVPHAVRNQYLESPTTSRRAFVTSVSCPGTNVLYRDQQPIGELYEGHQSNRLRSKVIRLKSRQEPEICDKEIKDVHGRLSTIRPSVNYDVSRSDNRDANNNYVSGSTLNSKYQNSFYNSSANRPKGIVTFDRARPDKTSMNLDVPASRQNVRMVSSSRGTSGGGKEDADFRAERGTREETGGRRWILRNYNSQSSSGGVVPIRGNTRATVVFD